MKRIIGKRKNYIVFLLAVLIGFLWIGNVPSATFQSDSTTPPADFVPVKIKPKIGSTLFLIIKDYNPWEVPANEWVLQEKGQSYDVINTSMIADWDFEAHGNKIIIIASDQGYSSYDNLIANRQKLADFVNNGGILLAHCCDAAWHTEGKAWYSSFLPGGVLHEINYDQTLEIMEPTHPLVEGITDEQLDWWNYSTHGYFTNLPPNTKVIIEDSGKPTYIEYKYGRGTVLSTMQTIEWPFQGWVGTRQLLRNEIDYALSLLEIVLPGQDVRVTETIPATNVEYLPETVSEEPYEVRYVNGKTIIEWRYDSIAVDEVKTITFNSIVHNPVPGEDRMVNESLNLTYTNLQGGTTTYSLGPKYVHVYRSEYLINVSTDKKEYNPNEDVLITTNITPPYSTTATCDVQIEDSEGNLVTKVGTINLSQSTPGEINTYTFTWNTGSTYAGEYFVHAILYEKGVEIDDAFSGFTILPLPVAEGLNSSLVTNKVSYSSNENVEITSKVKSSATNYIYGNLLVNISILNPDGEVIFSQNRLINLLPGDTNTAKIYWNTGTNVPGEYTVKQKVVYKGEIVQENEITFSIVSSIKAKTALAGYIKVEPQSVLMGQSTTFSYQVTNIGNVDLANLTLKVMVVDPDTQTVPEGYTYTEQGLTLLKSESHSREFAAVINLPPKYYMVIFQGEIENTKIPIASTYLLVKLPATIIIKPESFKKNTGTFTAFVKFPEGYDVSTITDAECDGAPAYNLIYDSEENQMILKFSRDEVKVLPIDIHFVVTGHFGDGLIFEGYDDIMKVVLQ